MEGANAVKEFDGARGGADDEGAVVEAVTVFREKKY
jgi:hypothetical protein